MLKRLAKIFLGFILLLVTVGVILIFAVNTKQNKAAIQAAVLSSTGYELTIAGDMTISFFPAIELTLNDVRLKNPDSPQELASTSAALLRVDLQALMRRKLLIRELSTDDFHINYYVDTAGKSNWDVSASSATRNFAANTGNSFPVQQNSPPGSPNNTQAQTQERAQERTQERAQARDGNIVIPSFERLQIRNASIDIQDLSRSLRYSVNKLELVSNDTNLEGRPFSINVNFDFLNNGVSKPMAMDFSSDVVADINAGTISVENINFKLTPMLLQGNLQITNLHEEISFQGILKSNSFDATGLMQTVGINEIDEDFESSSAALANSQSPPISYEFNFSGDEFGLEIPDFLLSMADTKIEADANIRFATTLAPTNINYKIVSNRINLTPFFQENSSADVVSGISSSARTETSVITNSVANNSMTASDTEISAELLNSLNVLGSISIASIAVNDMNFTNINVLTNVEDGVLDIEIQPISTFSGFIQGNVRLDGSAQDAVLSAQLSLSQLNIAELAPGVSRPDSVTGNLDVEIDFTASGNSTTTMRDSVSGSSTFAVTENSVDIGVLKQIFTAIFALSPSGGTIEQWPDVIRFAELSGFILLENGPGENQQIKLRMDNFDISGTGGIQFNEQTFDYDLLFTILGEPYLQTIPVDDLYHEVSWPVNCAAAFADEVSQYCRPDFTQVREIFTQIGSNAVRSNLNEIISDQLPPEIRDSARGLLRNLLN